MDNLLANANKCEAGTAGQILLQLISTLFIAQCNLKPEYPRDAAEDYLWNYDFIVVGAGSAGSMAAARLAKKNQDWQVLLIEAGSDPQMNSEIPILFYDVQNTEQDWQYRTTPQKHACRGITNHQCAWPRGKLLGGTSAINAMIYNMGNPADYDEWAQLGNKDWDWKSVKPYFEEHLSNDDEALNPVEFDVNDTDPSSISEMRQNILNAGKELGYEIISDRWKKSQGTVGFYSVLGTVKNGVRNNAARAYLTSVAKHENFHLIKNGHVTKVVIDKETKQVKGVEVVIGKNKPVFIEAKKEVVLSAGAINTPQLLMLSGVGPKIDLKSVDIPVLQDLPVGENLQDHSAVFIPLTIKSEEMNNDNAMEIAMEEMYRYLMHRKGMFSTTGTANIASYFNPKDKNSNVGEISYHYLYVRKNDEHSIKSLIDGLRLNDEVGDAITTASRESSTLWLLMTLLRPKSSGTLKLQTSNTFDPPIMDPNYFANHEDLETLLAGIRFIQKLLKTSTMQKLKTEFLKFNFEECLDTPHDSDDYWKCFIKQLASTLYHPVGTAKMGVDELSVVDPQLKVRGIHGLRVADASVMPKIVGGNTNAPCMMIGAKVADLIASEWNQKSL